MKIPFLTSILLVCASALSSAAVLDKPPTPMEQGGMVHVNITFLDVPSNPFSISLDPGSPVLQPLSLWEPGDTFDPADPWYTALDPTQEARPFNSQYGLLIDGVNSDPLPSGTSIGVRMTSSTPGLDVYFLRTTSGSELFDPVFTPAHDYVLWGGTMWHPMFTADGPGTFSADFEVFLADSVNASAVDYTTLAGVESGYSVGTFTLNWTSVPEPGTAGLVLMGLGALLLRRRRQG